MEAEKEGISLRKKREYRVKHRHSPKPDSKPSINEPVIAQKISHLFQIPDDMLASAPILTGYGSHRFCVENYRNIIEYTEEVIRIQTKTCRIHILGKRLVIAYFREDAMCVMGDISCVEYH